jgi:LPS export ABC transporter permease LptG/LPS export ABC transporter permease LptF
MKLRRKAIRIALRRVARIFGTIDRLVIREVLPPTLLGFMTYTFLVIMRGIFNLIEQILIRGVAFADAFQVMLITLPHIVVLTIPMSFLFGVLIAVGRMSADNEIVAIQAGGIPARRLLRPIVGMGVLLTILNGFLYLSVIPGSGRELRELKYRLFAEAKNLGRIEPKVFHEQLPNVLLYLRDADPDTGEWRDILFFDSSNPAEERLTLAQRGRMVTAGVDAKHATGGMPEVEQWIRLEDVVTHQFSKEDPETYRMNRTKSQLFRPEMNAGGKVRFRLGMGERETHELINFLRGGEFSSMEESETSINKEDRAIEERLAAVELNKRLAIPFACVVFAFLALPLGVGSRSGGRGRGFVISVGVVLAYYLVNNQGEMMAMEGKVPPWLGIWLPNIVLMAVALILMTRMGRWLGEREKAENPVVRLLKWAGRRWSRSAPGGSGSERPPSGSIPLQVQRRRYSTRFPALFDRYVTRRLLPPILLVVGSTALLYVVADLSSNVEDMARNDVPAGIIFAYYINLVPQVFLDVTPFALMIAVLILLTLLERQQEMTALKAAGISLYRLTVPVLLVAAVSAACLWFLGEAVVPNANREAQRLLDRIRGRETTRTYRASDRQWLLSRSGESLYNFLRFDDPSDTLIRFTMFRIDENMDLGFYLFSRRVRHIDNAWIADSGWFRQIFPDGTEEFKRITAPLKLEISEDPSYFGQEYRQPSEMSVGELGSYIQELVESGYRPSKLIVRWHQKFAYPLSAFVMVLLALPFGLSRGGRRVTTMQGVAVALILGIAYFMLTALFGRLGEVEVLPPLIGAWAPVVLAVLFAINRLTTLRT